MDPGRAESLQPVATTVRDSVAGLRSLLVDVFPPSLRSAGLASTLHDLASGASGHGAVVVADIDAEVAEAAPEEQQEVMFRIAQEALRNALRHAEAGRITLRLAADPDGAGRNGAAVLEVADDGRGFDGRGSDGSGAAGGGQPEVRVVALTSFSDRRRVTDVLAAGAIGYLLKDSRPEEPHRPRITRPTSTLVVLAWLVMRGRAERDALDAQLAPRGGPGAAR